MAKVGAQRAAVLTGRSKSTIQRAMNSGKLSFEIDQNDRRVIDVSELERVFGIKQQSLSIPAQASPASAPAGSIASAAPAISVDTAVERENMRMQIKMLEQQLHTAQEHIDDLKDQRDKWEKQASQVLITSQYSQRQAEELKAQIREREDRARQRRAEMEQQGSVTRKMPPPPAGGLLTQGDADAKKNSYKQPSQQPGQDIKKLDEQMRGLKADNQNADGEIFGSVFRFWKRSRN